MEESEKFKEWQRKMRMSDRDLPRYAEDLITAYGTEGLPEATLKKYTDKRSLRASLDA